MSINAYERCYEVIRPLHFNLSQNSEEILNEQLQTIGFNSDYLKNEPALFEMFRQKLYRKLNRYYYELVVCGFGKLYLPNKDHVDSTKDQTK